MLAALDASVAWLVDRGFSAQWGSEPFSSSERRREQAARWVGEELTLIAGERGRVNGVLTLGEAPTYVEQSSEPEIYVELLASSHRAGSKGVGRDLLGLAQRIAMCAGVEQLRVDCYAGSGGRLVRFYEGCGFIATASFQVGDWPGRVLVWPVRQWSNGE